MEDKIQIDLVADLVDLLDEGFLFEKLDKVARIALRICGIRSGTASIVLSDDSTLKDLNRIHRGVDEVTDVLSFSNEYGGEYYGSEPQKTLDYIDVDFVMPPAHPHQIGEIVISMAQASRQAEDKAVEINEELMTLVAHGFLHLLGYDHMELNEKAEMEFIQEKVMTESNK